MLNAIGLDNDGIHHFISHHLPYLRTVGTAVIANIAGEDEDQFVAMAEMLGSGAGTRGDRAEYLVPERQPRARPRNRSEGRGEAGAARCGACPLPIIAKLTPNVTDIVPIAAAAADAGADAVSLINTIRGVAVDWRRRRPILAYDVGGLSGPAIKPIALRMVWEVARALPGLPIIGIGGIATADDALEFLVAGASAVQVGTATFYDPTASERMVDELTRRARRGRSDELRQIIGTLRSNRR